MSKVIKPKSGRWNQAAIVVEAEALADEVGFHNLTMAGLAARLGVKPPSLYKHFAHLDDVRAALQARAVENLSEVALRSLAGHSGRRALLAFAHAYHTYLQEHASALAALASPLPADATARRASLRQHQTHFMRVLCDVLLAEGLDDTQCIHALRGLRSLVHGFANLEAEGGFEVPIPTQESFAWFVERYLDGLGLSA